MQRGLGSWVVLLTCAVGFAACGQSEQRSGDPPDERGGEGGEPSMTTPCRRGELECAGRCVDPDLDRSHCGDCATSCAAGMLCSRGQCASTCAAPTVVCDGVCVDTSRDTRHCGDCELACGDAQFCVRGACVSSCSTGTTACDGACVNTDEDADHCGDCDTRCASDERCSRGVCGVGCVGGTTECGDRCVDTDTDPDNCGDCDFACEGDEVCSRGRCGLECVGGTTRCDERCVDLDGDREHCGSCDTSCEEDELCSAGECSIACGGNTKACGDTCADVLLDPAHCGRCGHPCDAGEVCSEGKCQTSCGSRLECDGRCVNTDTDRNNCGDCEHACPSDELCSQGACGTICENSVLCGDECSDLLGDEKNCGGCGRSCGAGEKCENGICGLYCEDSGLVECANECVDTTTDDDHCGSCFNACATNYECTSGSCECANGKTECNYVCVDTDTDASNCGLCGVACALNEACTDGTCDCREGTTRCDSACVDTSISAAHCGGCDQPCAAGKVCTDGVCSATTSHWPTFQSDVAHSGVNATETGKPPLTLAWSRDIKATSPGAIQSGRLYVTTSTYFGDTSPLQALNVSDGSDLWSYNFGGVFSVGAPSVFGGAVYVANGKANTNAYLWSFDAVSGSIAWAAPLNAQWETYWAPLRVGDVVYTNAGYYGGIYGFAAADGAQKFFLSLDQYDQWSAAYFDGHLFTYMAGNFRKHDLATGAVLSTVKLDWAWNGYSVDTAPVFDDQHGYIIAPPNLVAIDPAEDEVAWTANGTYTGTPAVAGGLVYGISAGNLVVRSASGGSLAWTFVGDTALKYPPVIANGYVYVASDSHVYAVDTATHTAAWTGDTGGWLSVAARRVIVAGPTALTAYVLSQ